MDGQVSLTFFSSFRDEANTVAMVMMVDNNAHSKLSQPQPKVPSTKYIKPIENPSQLLLLSTRLKPEYSPFPPPPPPPPALAGPPPFSYQNILPSRI